MDMKEKNIIVLVRFPSYVDSRIDWNAPKEEFPRLRVEGFAEAKQDNPFSSYKPIDTYSFWTEEVEVEDRDGLPLPRNLFAIIYLSGNYYPYGSSKLVYGVSLWYVKKAFISLEKAHAYIQDKDTRWGRYWVIRMIRFR
ncbi:MAG: hypothetical protein ACD_7C00205G0001 [uncultured bacterium]|nr:MAG: hypothetical protein ACD_7C00205G0001 [uncultured bacterium]